MYSRDEANDDKNTPVVTMRPPAKWQVLQSHLFSM